MISFPEINPNLIEFGPIKVRWYGVMYALGFLASYLLISRQPKARSIGLHGQRLQDLLFYLVLGLIIGARIGYILLYQFPYLDEYIRHPVNIIAVWHGGMSFHGGLIGTVLGAVTFCRLRRFPFWEVADIVIVTVPVGLGLGRLGNFINGELYGRVSTMPWAMIFPGAGPLPRHPSQLYEAVLEGVFLFAILWLLKDRRFRPGTMVCLFLTGYGILRFILEFFRQPDPQIGILWGAFSMGQILCLIMIIAGFTIWPFLPVNKLKN